MTKNRSRSTDNGKKLPPVTTSKAKGTAPAATKKSAIIALPPKNVNTPTTEYEAFSNYDNVTTHKPVLQFTPYSWAKLLFMRDKTDNEVGAFGIADQNDLLLIHDIAIVGQQVGPASMEFEDEAIADFYDAQTKAGRKPAEYARIWIHTHPGGMTTPSSIDFNNLNRVFGGSDWAVMFILAQSGATSCELRFNVGPKASLEIPVRVNYKVPFPASDINAWEHEYTENVIRKTYTTNKTALNKYRNYGRWDDKKDDMSCWWDNLDNSRKQESDAVEPISSLASDWSVVSDDSQRSKDDDEIDIEYVDEEGCDWCNNICDTDKLLYCEHCYSAYCPECFETTEVDKKDKYVCYGCELQIVDPVRGLSELDAMYAEVIDK